MKSQNKEHGFYGTIAGNSGFFPETTWNAASRWVKCVMPMWNAETVRDFLDSAAGRRLADEVISLGGFEKIDHRDWFAELYSFAAGRSSFLNHKQVENVNHARKLACDALTKLTQAKALLEQVQAQIADSAELEKIERQLGFEAGEIGKMLNNRHWL